MNILDQFINYNRNGFYGFTLFEDELGFSIKKDLRNDGNTSQLSFYFQKQKVKENLAPILISATYGQKVENGVRVRSKVNFLDPVDLNSENDYFYDINNGKLLKGKREITPDHLIDEIYNIHIKSIKSLRGFFNTAKLFFWRVFVKNIYTILSVILRLLLFLVKGNRYSYEPLFEKEISDGQVVRAKYPDMVSLPRLKDKEKKSEVFNFWGYKVEFWVMAFYSALNLSIYLYFELNNFTPKIVNKILENNLLLINYAFLSLYLVDIIIPSLLKWSIKRSSISAYKFLYKKIKL